jgi:hypothetical protein
MFFYLVNYSLTYSVFFFYTWNNPALERITNQICLVVYFF